MGLLTSLLVGGALAGGLFAGKKLAPKPTTETPSARSTVPGVIAPPTPPDATKVRSEAQTAAQQAAVRQRRRAGTGLGTVLARPAGTAPLATASLQPRTLGGF